MRWKQLFEVPAALGRSWFELTADEQKAALIICAIFLMGIGVRLWHVQKKQEAAGFPQSEIVQHSGPQQTGKGVPLTNEH